MKTAELVGEYMSALRRTTVEQIRGLMRAGIPWRSVTIAGPALARIRCDDAFYLPDPAGTAAFIMPVCVVDPNDPEWIETGQQFEDVVSGGPVVDLVAFSPACPRRWRLRCGNALVLGAIEPQYLCPDPVPVRRDITDWLRAGCNGIVLLTTDPHERSRILRQIIRLEAEDGRHAAELRRLLEMPWPVRSTVGARHAAA